MCGGVTVGDSLCGFMIAHLQLGRGFLLGSASTTPCRREEAIPTIGTIGSHYQWIPP